MATCLVTDILVPNEKLFKIFNPSDRFYTIVTKVSSACFGLACLGMSYIAAAAGEGLLQAALSLFGILGGPNMAVFFLGALVPFAEPIGVFIADIVGVVVAGWVCLPYMKL